MQWGIIIGLSAIVLFMFAVYKVSLREIRGLDALLVRILLDEATYTDRRNALLAFVHAADAKTKEQLYWKTCQEMTRLAMQQSGGMPAASLALWVAKIKDDIATKEAH